MARLPDEFQEVEYIKYIPSKTYCLGGFTSQEDAIKRVSELQKECPSVSYDIGTKIEQKIAEYIIVFPEEAIAFLSENEKRSIFPQPQPPLQCVEYTPTVYRFVSEKNVASFFETGNLKITTFSHCKKLESQTRRDSEEGQGTAIGIEEDLRCEIGSVVDDNALMLCTSLSENNNLPDGTHYAAAIQINNIIGFVSAITEVLINNGYQVSTILKGPCIYNNRLIQRELHDQSLSELNAEMENSSSFDFGKLFALQSSISSGDLFFSKPVEKSVENEYRIIWLLDSELKEDCIFIDVPEARQYCQKIVFDK